MALMFPSGCEGDPVVDTNGKEIETPDLPVPPEVKKYSISVLEGEHGLAEATIAGEVVTQAEVGAIVSLAAIPDADYRFSEWLVESELASLPNRAETEFVMPAEDISVKPLFEPVVYYAIELSSRIPRSFITVKVFVAGQEAVRAGVGEEVTLVATAKDGYGFNYWGINNVDNDAIADDIMTYPYSSTTTFLMPEYPILVSCSVVKNAYWVRVENDGNGYATVGMLPNANAFYWGSDVEITAIPNAGYKFKEWTDVVGIEGIDSRANPLRIVTPQGEVTMKATFEAE